ncbi:MAG: hypothetical protein NW214_14945 [Pseudanabaenaceae cyanobacterium bins.39]|nr:hypothetical protein [Pseudanabaenaceae cyanobacterium bins.39]
MTTENSQLQKDLLAYYVVETNANELVLQPPHSRGKAIRDGWWNLVVFQIFVTGIIAALVAFLVIITLIILDKVAPNLKNDLMSKAILLFSLIGLGGSIALGTLFAWYSGYKTFIFDRVQQQLIIHTVNLFGKKVVKKIDFEKIKEARLDESESFDDISIRLLLIINKSTNLGNSKQEEIILSQFSSEYKSRSIDNLTALKLHKELLLSVKKFLGISTDELENELSNFQIPNNEQIEKERKEALINAKEQIRELTKTIFSRNQAKQEQFEALRQKILKNPEDPYVWEQLAIQLSLQRNPQIHEVSHAYRRAESLYRDRGKMAKADDIVQILKRIG